MALGAGAGVGYAITQGVQIDFPSTPVWIFLAGALAVSAWLLPGVSGSFILLILGLYETVLVSIKSLDWQFLLVFAAGCAIGLLTFARILSAAFRRYEAAVLAVLTGFMLGSVGRLWPWQRTVSYRLDEEMRATALITEPISPAHYEALTGLDAQIPVVIVLMCAGAACVWLLERLR